VIALAVTAAGCAPGLMKLPTGAGTPASDVRDALVQATNTCQGIRTLSAEVAVSGSVATQGLRGRMLVGLAAPDAGRIEAVAPFGPPVFILVAKNDDATLLRATIGCSNTEPPRKCCKRLPASRLARWSCGAR
jgi:hypothetical protein